jgi:hypothetical protein
VNLPRNAQSIVDARLNGLRPDAPVFVSYVGSLPVSNRVVYAESGKRYDWRFLHGLTVFIAVSSGIDASDAMQGAWNEMAMDYPTVIDYERQQLACVVMVKPLQLWQVKRNSSIWQEHFA